MNKLLLFTFAIACCGTSQAQSICRVFEYAELKDMQRTKLEELYCDYREGMYVMIKVALDEINAGHRISSARANNDSNRCAQELSRIEGVLDSKFQVKSTKCRPIPGY